MLTGGYFGRLQFPKGVYEDDPQRGVPAAPGVPGGFPAGYGDGDPADRHVAGRHPVPGPDRLGPLRSLPGPGPRRGAGRAGGRQAGVAQLHDPGPQGLGGAADRLGGGATLQGR